MFLHHKPFQYWQKPVKHQKTTFKETNWKYVFPPKMVMERTQIFDSQIDIEVGTSFFVPHEALFARGASSILM